MKINWLTKSLIHFSPKLFFRLAARENKLDYRKIEEAENLFRNAKRIDFSPSGGSGGRSLIIVIDNKLSLFLAATSTISLSALYEVEEYVEDIFFKTNRLGPGVDTASDLLFNILGVASIVIFITIYYLITHKRRVI